MISTVLADTGPLTALFDKDDRFHQPVVEFLKNGKFRLVTTTAVLTEVCHLLDFSVDAQLDFFQWILKSGVRVEEVGTADLIRVIELTKKYADRPMDFADATLVVVAERTGIRQIISIDSDFDVYQLPGKVQIENVFGR